MKIKILKSGKWGKNHYDNEIIEIKEGCIEIICKERIHKELAGKMIAAGWAEEMSEKEESIPEPEPPANEEINEYTILKKRKRGRPFKVRK